MRKFLKNYWVEMIVLLAVLVALFMLVGNFELVRAASRGLNSTLNQVNRTFVTATNQLIDKILGFSLFDLLGVAIIVGASFLLYNRARYRYRTNPNNTATVCPRCGSQIKRIHRSSFDRLLSKTFKPNARRYSCVNSACGWDGLRVKRYRPEQSLEED
jgi:predicted RNA-binding Zn-ribbon protein involved in translation (DUF1610 family)